MSTRPCRTCGKLTSYKNGFCAICERIKKASEENRPEGYAVPVKPAHTPTPWMVFEKGYFRSICTIGEVGSRKRIVKDLSAEDAAFIVQAVNAHEDFKRMAISPNWEKIWGLMNAFASGQTQKQHARVEPLAVLSEVYLLLAQIEQERKQAIAKAEVK